ncbi:DUF6082 family protein [Streptomyces sp. NPDC047081]|uniref:DUF6082 family protein n=1 Tax=Streptomyces sp. NPDC047081 TaxID=3154706 RepID=UPI0033D3A40E
MQSAARGYAGESFGAAAAASSVVVLIYIARTFHQQGEESRLMRKVAEEQHNTARRVAEASIREQHRRLTQMALDDPLLMAVWPAYGPDITEDTARQFMYANLILTYQRTCWEMEYIDDAEFQDVLHYIFSSTKMCEFWEKARGARDGGTPHSGEMRDFYDIAEMAYQRQLLNMSTRSGADDLAEPH